WDLSVRIKERQSAVAGNVFLPPKFQRRRAPLPRRPLPKSNRCPPPAPSKRSRPPPMSRSPSNRQARPPPPPNNRHPPDSVARKPASTDSPQPPSPAENPATKSLDLRPSRIRSNSEFHLHPDPPNRLRPDDPPIRNARSS